MQEQIHLPLRPLNSSYECAFGKFEQQVDSPKTLKLIPSEYWSNLNIQYQTITVENKRL